MKESFVSRLRKAMEIRDMKQADLVERTGLSKSAISQYYSGIFEFPLSGSAKAIKTMRDAFSK